MSEKNKRIGITSTIPVEVILSANCIPIDLNNIFIAGENPQQIVTRAEELGYPRSLCAWIKGIYATVVEKKPVDLVVIITQGDCSNTLSMMETFKIRGIPTLTFDYPYDRNREKLKREIEKFAKAFETTIDAAEKVREKLIPIRQKLVTLDRLTYEEFLVTGLENHLWLVSASDFRSDTEKFEEELDNFLGEVTRRNPAPPEIRLGLIGVPPIIPDLYEYIEKKSARVIFNEMQRQFAMPSLSDNLIEQYLSYTYPYDIFHRIDAIQPEIEKRKLQGIIHYVQSFCHRQIEDIIFRKKLQIPILTIEGDRPSPIDERIKIRIDTFLDLISSQA